MKGFLQRLKGQTSETATGSGARVTLGAFGKHPGWDDHILGIGGETEVLAQVKQTLYITGIGGQIDSGGWEKLPAEKRVAGYDHTFLWLRPGHVVLGQFWSSVDGKGRTKYPMVLCLDGEGMDPASMLAQFLPELERLREAFKATASAEQVTRDFRTAQEQLRAGLATLAPKPVVSNEARRAFLERPEFGENQAGFLRIVHELERTGLAGSRHLRLPLAGQSPANALECWSAFLRDLIPAPTPLLLLVRQDANYLDVISGQPSSEDFFCLQASTQAMPLTTEIPYEIAPGCLARLQTVLRSFLGGTEIITAPGSGGTGQPATPPASSTTEQAPATPPQKSGGRGGMIAGITLLLLLAGAGAWWIWGRGDSVGTDARTAVRPSNQVAATVPSQTNKARQPVAQGTNPSPAAEQQKASALAQYQAAITEAQAAFQMKNYTIALGKAETALAIKDKDPEATKLKADAERELVVLAAAREQENNYQRAMVEGQAALQRKDYTNVLAKAEAALALKPNDAEASKLKAAAVQQIQLAAVVQVQEEKYRTAIMEGQSALQRKDFATALAKAEMALALKSNDPEAKKLKANAQLQLDLGRAQNYFAQGQYTQATDMCRKYANDSAFNTVAASVAQEEKLLKDAGEKFAAGDYSFVDQVKAQPCAAKQGFADLLTRAAEEKKVLGHLQTLQQSSNWAEANKEWRALGSASFLTKPPFAAMRSWAETPPQEESKQTTATLTAELEKYLVWFRVIKPTDPKIVSAAARNEKPIDGQISPEDKEWYLTRLDALKTQFEKAGLLSQNDRQRNFRELKNAILLR